MRNPVKIIPVSWRRCYYRGEQAVIKFDLMNFNSGAIPDCRLKLELTELEQQELQIPSLSSHAANLQFVVDTGRMKSGEYPFYCHLYSADTLLAEYHDIITTVPSRRRNGMAFWHWPSTVHYNALEAGMDTALEELDKLAELGFTWSQFSAEWAILNPHCAARLIEEAMKRGIELGILLKNGNGGIFAAKPDDPPQALATNADGGKSYLLDPDHPYTREKIKNQIISLMRLFGEFPSCTTVFANSEVEDKLKLPCSPGSCRKHEKHLGFPLSKLRSVERVFANSFPDVPEIEPGIIDDDDIECRYARYYFKHGDGWRPINSLIARTVHRFRPDVQVLSDPFRLIPLAERLHGLDIASSWTYINPDAKTTLFIESLAAAARRNKQDFLHTITLWNYAGSLVPCFDNRFSRKHTLRMGPDRWSECAWINFSRGPRGIGCYFGSSLDLIQQNGDPFILSPETEKQISRFSREILQPFGELTRLTENAPRRVAVLDSLASRIWGDIPRFHTHYQNYQIYNFYSLLAMAQIPADVIFEEDILDGKLSRYDILVLPCAGTLTLSVANHIRDFTGNGGIVWSDQYLRASFKVTYRFDFDFMPRKRVSANMINHGQDFSIKDDTNFRREWKLEKSDGVTAAADQQMMENYACELRRTVGDSVKRDFDCSSSRILCNLRNYGQTAFLYAVNDHRTYGLRTGQYQAVLEKGVDEPVEFTLYNYEHEPFIYEMVSGKRIKCRYIGNGSWSFAAVIPAAWGGIFAIFPQAPSMPQATYENNILKIRTINSSLANYQISLDGSNDFSGCYPAPNGKIEIPIYDHGQIEITDLTCGKETVLKIIS